ncbi:hypothetical protein [uncultured Methylobacterium sp.]|jgi:hypothetical protein|uniref:hypothetical protein n=1 Tax=uncultured Methylobacterium sp. TaxID=157278 RepID=UPI00261F3C51|nr:hypothetical protein [uncultured Methylobacterium sp.]
MLVYGDVIREEPVGEALDRLGAALRALPARPAGLDRHAALVAVLLDAAGLAQGLADAAFAEKGGRDGTAGASEAAGALVADLARAVWASWRSGFAEQPAPGLDSVARLARASLPATVSIRLPEGHAFYAVYPEGHAVAARASGLPAATRVVGIRSIGTSLGAMVAAGIGAAPPVTVRPTGHPFARRLSLSPEAEARLLGAPGYAVADEGPGLSGSSFGAVADALEDRGVAPGRIAFFPSHGGAPGPRASERHRARWERAARHWIGFDDLILHAETPAHRLATWAAGLLGPLDGPLGDLSGGAWRRRVLSDEADWPGTCGWQERRKFVAAAGGRTWLLKFAGLGREGERKLARARALAAAGFTPAPAGLLHGFLVERWHGEARSLDPTRADPEILTARVGAYLGFRARSFPAASPGAGLDRLVEMARHNAGAALGAGIVRRFDRWSPGELRRLAQAVRPVETDNRMQAWEWRVLPDGRILKTDALDHHAGHDLVGCQDIAWDVVGAEAELGLPAAALAARVAEAAGRAPDPALLALLRPCYRAFRLGALAMAADGADPAEAGRLRREADSHAARLAGVLDGG